MNITTKQKVFHFFGNDRKCLFSEIRILLLLFFIVGSTLNSRAQLVTVKSNLADWMTVSPNLGVEFILGNHLSIDMSVTAAPFKIKKDIYFQHLRLQPELKYWLSSLLTRHYVGATAFYSIYDVGYKQRGYFGDSYAAGLTYGYNWILSRRWNLEIGAGLGIIRYRMARYIPGTLHPEPNEAGWKIAPVKLGINFVYVLK